ncbi:hypothetical protein SDC9_119233 [bioreactor metagenome]|uniref:Uncharacterized protein n=1 Tax=bioreactor metagenome TaxID=1076179 RepID=A0A645C3B1_9ZZZZ
MRGTDIVLQCLGDHLAADKGEQPKCNPVIDADDIRRKLFSQNPSYKGHHCLKKTKKQGDREAVFPDPAFFRFQSFAERCRKGIHREADGDQQQF